jgi:MFS family permease
MVTTMLVLAVLGMGWNLAVVGGSTLLVQTASPDLRPRVEGLGELAMGAAAAVSGPIAGILVAPGGLPAVCALGLGAAACGLAYTRPSRSTLTLPAQPRSHS